MPATHPAPKGHTLTPSIAVRDAAAPGGKIAHAELRFGDSVLMMSAAPLFSPRRCRFPTRRRGRSGSGDAAGGPVPARPLRQAERSLRALLGHRDPPGRRRPRGDDPPRGRGVRVPR